MRPDDIEQLTDDLRHYHADLEAPEVRAALVDACLPRLLATLEMIPDAARGGDFLELGATPFFLTLCLRRWCTGRVALGNWFGTGERRGSQRLVHARTGAEITLAYDLFNVETDLFPYPDESFDVVVFSELVEHLAVNPVRTLSEIHRVLRPGGCMILTTPNAVSFERLETYLNGGSQMVDRYSPLFGPGARHNREYHARELDQLLDGNGFIIEELSVRNLKAHPVRERLRRAWWNLLLAASAAGRDLRREEHIFLRARRAGRFGWRFHPNLFDNIDFYILVRHPWMEMGVNDSIQCGEGWFPLEARDDKAVRRIRGVAQGFLKSMPGRLTFHIELFATPGADPLALQIIVWDRWLGRPKLENVYVDRVVTAERGRWQRFDLPLERHPLADDELEIRVAVNGDARANPPAAEPAVPERDVAVHRFWLSAAE